MAPRKKSTKKLDKKKKRKWYSIYTPKSYGSAEIGESFVSSPQMLIGKKIRVNPIHLTRVRSPSIRITLQIKEVKEEKALTEEVQYEILSNFVNRIVRKRKSKVDTSQKLKTKDDQKVVLKTIIITRGKIKGGVSTSLKNEVLKVLEEKVKKETFNKLFDSILNYSFQKSIVKDLKKITPIQKVEIKHFSKK